MVEIAEKMEREDRADQKPQEEVEPKVQETQKWYVIHTYSGYENKVKTSLEKRLRTMNLEDKISEILIPTEEVVETKGGKRRVLSKKFFPGYILIKMELTEDSWHVVRHTQGVFGFIGEGNKPIPLKDEDVQNMLYQIGTGEIRIKPSLEFEVGESVRVVNGPFVGFIGVVEEVNLKKGTVVVRLGILGRNTPVELEFAQVGRL